MSPIDAPVGSYTVNRGMNGVDRGVMRTFTTSPELMLNVAVSISDHWLIAPIFVSPLVSAPMPGLFVTIECPGVSHSIDTAYVPVREP